MLPQQLIRKEIRDPVEDLSGLNTVKLAIFALFYLSDSWSCSKEMLAEKKHKVRREQLSIVFLACSELYF